MAAVAAATLVIIGAGPAGARPSGAAHPSDGAHAPMLAARLPWSIGVSPDPCLDRGYALLGAKWHIPYRWSFDAKSTPAELDARAVRAVLERSFANLTSGRNDCGRADGIGATSEYTGMTSPRANCRAPDGRNVVGFGRLQYGVLAVTCYWTRNGRMVEADIKINDREMWALAFHGCRNRPILEATITHEAGHVFGLDHIGERKHGRLTMSPYLDGPCENAEASLGLGDMLGLEALY